MWSVIRVIYYQCGLLSGWSHLGGLLSRGQIYIFLLLLSCVTFSFFSLSFPEIPLFHVLNARVTFGNIFGSVSSANFVTLIREPTMSCVVDEQCFEAPPTYHQSGEDDIINNNDGPFSGVFTIASM